MNSATSTPPAGNAWHSPGVDTPRREMFPSKRITQLEQQVADLTAQNTTLTSERDDALAERDNLQAQLGGVITAEAHQAVVAERDDLQQRVTDLEAASQTAGQQAAEIVASVAVPPVASEQPGAQAKTVAEIRAAFDAERDPKKRAALWAELKAAMQ